MDETQIVILVFVLGTLKSATPLVFASLGGLVSERSGVIQIALEGFMLMGALWGAIIAYETHSAWLGLLASCTASILLAWIYAYFVIQLKADQIITGTAINIFAVGIAPLITKVIFSSTGSTPNLDTVARFHTAPLFLAIFFVILVQYWFFKTRSGLIIRFAGEDPQILTASGISVTRVRWYALTACGFFCGLGGASLSLFLASSYSPIMTAGRGFVALAALIFGKWKPLPAVFACILFAAVDALQIRLQGVFPLIPVQFIQILPYVVTVIALAGFFGESPAPKAIGKR